MTKRRKKREAPRGGAGAASGSGATDESGPSAADAESADGARGGERTDFPIVGIGASAGGLTAFKEFFERLADAPGMAFVLVQHLDPDHESMMADLLSRHTRMPVVQVTDDMPVERDTVYIIPPGKYLTLVAGHLSLSEPPAQRGMRMAIDHFFESLAEVQQEKSICIILSGTGSDGTRGMKAVKANGGLAIVQDPTTAKHDGMLRSAIATGAVDLVMPPVEMAAALARYVRHPYVKGPVEDGEKAPQNDLDGILAVLHARTGHEFRCYKRSTVLRRVQRRMGLHHIERYDDYLAFVRRSRSELDELFRDMLIGVTSFFRDPEAWQILARDVIPKLIERCSPGEPLRAWVPGCSTGEEAYTLAILLDEALGRVQSPTPLQIFATDIDRDAYEYARTGRFPAAIAADVPSHLLERYFVRDEHTYQVEKSIREAVVFAPHSLIADPPFSRIDIISCRNVLIYLETEIQRKIMGLFHFALREGGYLFLGNSESVGAQRDRFEFVSKKWRIYRRIGHARPGEVELPFTALDRDAHAARRAPIATAARGKRNLAAVAQAVLLEQFTPAAVLVDRNHRVVYFNGPTGDYLQQPTGEPTNDVLGMAVDGLRTKLRSALRRAGESEELVVVEDARIKTADGGFHPVRLMVRPLRTPSEAEGLLLVTFEALPAAPGGGEPEPPRDGDDESLVQQLEYELKATREELQSTIEELETSNEELKASNEEVMSMNEELQSTNEELETSKEELQSLNEELTTVNNELQEKVQQQEETTNDLANLLSSTDIATVFLDRELNVKRFTPAATEVFHLVASDVGRPVAHIARCFDDPDFVSDARRVLDKLSPRQTEVAANDGRWYSRRILPYRTQDERIEGVVVTFTDVTDRKAAELAIAERERQLRCALLEAPLPVMLYAEDGEVLLVSRTWTEMSGYAAAELPSLDDWVDKAVVDRSFETEAHIEAVAAADARVAVGELTIRTKAGAERRWSAYAASIGHLRDGRRLLVTMANDVTDLRKQQRALRELTENLEETVRERTAVAEERSAQLRHLASELAQTEQRERRRLATTVHDHLQQLIAAARMRAGVARGADDAAPATEHIEELERLLDEAAGMCRSLTVELSPPVLYDDGLLAALRWLADWMGKQHGLGIDAAIDTELEPVEEEMAVFLFQGVRELLFNVVKHAGVSEARVTARTFEEGWLEVAVADDGAGFDVAAVRDTTSSGFGLFSISERLSLQGGRVEIDSAPGEGTRVRLLVPALPRAAALERRAAAVEPRAAAVEPRAAAGPARTTGSPAATDGPIRVLLADDHAAVRDAFANLLDEADDIEVVGAVADGQSAVEAARELLPDVVVMDVNMPRMNGIEATRVLSRELPDTTIIGLSVHHGTGTADSMRAAGATAYLTKGGPSEDLFRAIRARRRPADR